MAERRRSSEFNDLYANYVVSSSSSKKKESNLLKSRQGSQKRMISSQENMNVIDLNEKVQEIEEGKQ